VEIGGELRRGAASRDGHETVVGSALMLVGANSRTVAGAVGVKLQEIAKTLPPGIRWCRRWIGHNWCWPRSPQWPRIWPKARTRRDHPLRAAGQLARALIATLVIPLSLLISAIGMNGLNISGNLMSLGALDFGLIIDGAVIIVENSLRRLGERQAHEGRLLTLNERLEEVIASSKEMVRPTVYGQIVIFLVFLPCLTFQGVEGKMFSPMVITLMLALASAFVLVTDLCARVDRGAVQRFGRGQGSARDCRDQASL
jgi:cobalt-zinc-cadmium resistance protein CzcA